MRRYVMMLLGLVLLLAGSFGEAQGPEIKGTVIIRKVGKSVQIEVSGGRPFPIVQAIPELQIGAQFTRLSSFSDSGGLIFYMPGEDFAKTKDGDAIFVSYQGKWNFGNLDKSKMAQGKPPERKRIDAATVAAYEKLGAEYGGWQIDSQHTFQLGLKDPEKGWPAFRFKTFPTAKLPEVDVPFALDLAASDVMDAGLKELAPLKGLVLLNLRQTKVTDAGLKELTALKNLAALYLYSTKVTDAGVKELVQLKNLTLLDLDSTKVTDVGLKELTQLKKLTTLGLGVTKVSDAGLKELAGHESLKELFLFGTPVTDAGLKELTRLNRLTTLELTYTKVTDVGLKELAQLKNLTSLDLHKTQVTDAGVAELQKALPKCKIKR